jgi:hypothetical protein
MRPPGYGVWVFRNSPQTNDSVSQQSPKSLSKIGVWMHRQVSEGIGHPKTNTMAELRRLARQTASRSDTDFVSARHVLVTGSRQELEDRTLQPGVERTWSRPNRPRSRELPSSRISKRAGLRVQSSRGTSRAHAQSSRGDLHWNQPLACLDAAGQAGHRRGRTPPTAYASHLVGPSGAAQGLLEINCDLWLDLATVASYDDGSERSSLRARGRKFPKSERLSAVGSRVAVPPNRVSYTLLRATALRRRASRW